MGKKNSTILKVSGVTFSNKLIGGSRQEIIKKCNVGDPVTLERDYSNSYDEFAVKVISRGGNQIGFIPKRQSKRVANSIKKNNVTAKIHEKYGFSDDYNQRIYGVKISIQNLLSATKARKSDDDDVEGCANVIVFLAIAFIICLMLYLIFGIVN